MDLTGMHEMVKGVYYPQYGQSKPDFMLLIRKPVYTMPEHIQD